jgi:hypothetical protein
MFNGEEQLQPAEEQGEQGGVPDRGCEEMKGGVPDERAWRYYTIT